ncbi:SnoaL-like domain-containing protein [Rubrivivax sp. A210]|uniref:nuclear transport factor 2 family protein n=1 Tax=Rubrivivax sp. A210 TaxID=2772301 RepID=UPI001918CC1C|nr:nuclear transport factor 2 family protein [Rubrivivax sp. A210]CAD5373208.1 SnoaL-like domain-containing protein [Rubrivivax sp. A210]
MTTNTVQAWHEVVASRSPAALHALLADDVVFHSPVVHTPQQGRAITHAYLAAALQVFGNESFRYVRQIEGEREAVLEFMLEIDGIAINGVDLLRWDIDGRITEFKVMLRPLKAVNLIHQKMAAMLQQAPR